MPPSNCLMPDISNASGIYFTPCFLARHVVPQSMQTNEKAKIAFALVPFLRIFKGFTANTLIQATVNCDKVLLQSNKGMNNYELSFCTTIELYLRRTACAERSEVFIDKNSIHHVRETSNVKCETSLCSRLTFHFSLFTASMLKMPHPRH